MVSRVASLVLMLLLAAGSPNAGEIAFLSYHNQVMSRIRDNWAWAGRRADLEVTIRFGIQENGEITGLKILKRSGDASFDDSVFRAVTKANPLPPPPENYRKDFRDMELTFRPQDLLEAKEVVEEKPSPSRERARKLLQAPQLPKPNYDFPDRRALMMDTCPHVKLTDFHWKNFSERHLFNYSWTNVGKQPIVAFEIVTLKYDPFNQPQLGSRTVITGRNSVDFRPLPPGESSTDGYYGYGHTDTFTAVAYVKTVRLADGTVWQANEAQVRASLKNLLPHVTDYGSIAPEKQKAKAESGGIADWVKGALRW